MNKMRSLREAAGLTQRTLAEKARSHQPRIADWEKQPHENGYRRIPLDKAKLVAKALDCNLWDIRPDILSAESFDLMLEGSSAQFKKDIRDYIIFKAAQRT